MCSELFASRCQQSQQVRPRNPRASCCLLPLFTADMAKALACGASSPLQPYRIRTVVLLHAGPWFALFGPSNRSSRPIMQQGYQRWQNRRGARKHGILAKVDGGRKQLGVCVPETHQTSQKLQAKRESQQRFAGVNIPDNIRGARAVQLMVIPAKCMRNSLPFPRSNNRTVSPQTSSVGVKTTYARYASHLSLLLATRKPS
jgi:hypothetical protein